MPRLNTLGYVRGYGYSKSSAGTLQLESADGTQDAFVVKYNTLGKAQWAARIGGTGSDVSWGIFHRGESVYVVGEYASSILTFYNADGTSFRQLLNSGLTDVFIAKYNSSGVGQWVARIAGTNSDVGRGVAIDSSGDICVTGSFIGTVTVFNSSGASTGTLASSGAADAFLVKYTSSGAVSWRARLSGTGTEIGYAVACDASDNFIVIGTYGSTLTAVNANGSPFGTTLALAGTSDAFLVKYSGSGVVQWVTRIAGTGADNGFSIATDSSSNIYVSGSYAGTVTVYNQPGGAGDTFGTLGNAGNADVFVVKYNSSGAAQWRARMSGGGNDFGNAIAVDSSGNVYVAGPYGANLTVYNQPGGVSDTFTTLTNSGSNDIFVVKYDTNGAVQWATRISSTATDAGDGITVDSSGNVYVTGDFGGTATVFNASGSTFGTLSVPISGTSSALLVKYNTSGVVQWATRIPSASTTVGRDVSVDTNGNIYLGGQFTGSALSIYGQTLSLFSNIANAGNTDAFAVKYNTNGAPQWVARIASTGADVAFATAFDSSGNLYVGGQGGGTITISNADGSTFDTRASAASFLVKYNASGVVQWAVRMTGAGSSSVRAIAVDSNGNVFATGGNSHATMTIWDADNTTTRTLNSTSGDAFLIKYNSAGVSQWAARITGSAGELAHDVAVDSNGDAYICGAYSSAPATAQDLSGNSFATTLTRAGADDAFLVKYSSAGLVLWVARVSSTNTDIAYGLGVDSSNNVYISGQYLATISIISSDGSTFTTLATTGLNDAFLVKYNSSGIAQWAARVGGTGGAGATNEISYACAVDSDGNAYIGGNGTAIIFNSDGTTFRTLATGPAFLVKYNTSGFGQWAFPLAGTGASIRGIEVDSSKNVYVSGNLGSETANLAILNSDGSTFINRVGPIAVIKYDTNGIGKWVQMIRNITTSTAGTSLIVSASPQGDVCLVGASGSGSTVQIFNTDQTPYKFLNILSSTAVYIVKYSSTATPLWATQIASVSYVEAGYGIKTDSAGNVYVNGLTGNGTTADVYNANGTLYTSIPNAGNRDTYIVKYNSSGTGQWTARIASANADSAYALTVDPSDNVILGASSFSVAPTIYSSDNTTLTPGPTNSGGTDVYVVKYNSNGIAQWFGTLASTGEEYVYTTTSDSSGNVYITGHFAGTITVSGTGGSSLTPLAQAGSGDVFIAKWSSTGVALWVARVSSTTADYGIGAATDSSGNVYITGFYGAATATAFDASNNAFATTLAPAGVDDAFLAKYDPNGLVQWVARIAGTSFDSGRAVATDSGGNVYVVGAFSSTTLTVSNANGTTFGTLTGTSAGDVFVIKYNSSGTVQWATRILTIGSNVGDFTTGVTVDSAGAVYVVGYGGGTGSLVLYNSDGSFFGSTSVSTLAVNARQTFLVKYDSSGNVQWLSGMGGYGNDEGRAVAVDSTGNIYTTGIFTATGLVLNDA